MNATSAASHATGQRQPAPVRWLHPLPDPPPDDAVHLDAGERQNRSASPGIAM